MIIFRYLIKEVLVTVFATTLLLLLIFLSTQFIHYLTGAVGGRFTSGILLRIMMLQVPYLLGLLIPLGLFLALLLAFGRLHADREMIVLASCGLSTAQLIFMTLVMAMAAAIVVAFLSMWMSPKVALHQRSLLAEAKATPLVETILPGRFFSLENGKQVVYVEDVSRGHNHLSHIFVATKTETDGNNSVPVWSIISAEKGYQMNNQALAGRALVINHGMRYTGKPGAGDFKVEQFDEFNFLQKAPKPLTYYGSPDTLTSAALWKARNKVENAAELQWRISLPLSVILLSLLALPLSKVNPRQGKFAQLLPAILIYILYANMMFVTRSWIQTGALSPKIGFWWLHTILLLLVLILFFWQSSLKTKIHRYLFKSKNS